MKTKAWWTFISFVCAIALVVACWPIPYSAAKAAGAYQSSQEDEHGEMAGLVGAWLVETTVVEQDATFPALLTFTSDGIVLADEPPSPFETTGHGAWAATGPATADFTFVTLVGRASGALSMTYRVRGSVEYDGETDTWQGPFTIRIADANGDGVLTDNGTFAGTRIAVEGPDTVAEEAAAAPTALQPGDKVGDMMLAKGPDSLDLNVPPIAAFCNANPFIEPGATVTKPGEYTVECSMPPLEQLMIGFGWVAINAERRDLEWAAIDSELYVNGQAVDQPAFGRLDADVPVTGVPGMEASEVVTQALRMWNVGLENLQPGPLTLRWAIHVDEELYDGVVTVPAGTYDTIFNITVDESLAAEPGAPKPVELVQQAAAVFDAFNAAYNAHDVDAALSFFAEDTIVSFPNQPPPNRYTGLDEIHAWLEQSAADNYQVEIDNAQTSGDTVRAKARVHADSLPPDFWLEGTVEVTVEGGKITLFTYTLSDETLAALAALEEQQ